MELRLVTVQTKDWPRMLPSVSPLWIPNTPDFPSAILFDAVYAAGTVLRHFGISDGLATT